MSRYEGKMYDWAKRDKPTLQKLKTQLSQCQTDLERLENKPTTAALRSSLAERIGALHAEIRGHVEEKARARLGSAETQEDEASVEEKRPGRPATVLTSGRYPPRGRR